MSMGSLLRRLFVTGIWFGTVGLVGALVVGRVFGGVWEVFDLFSHFQGAYGAIAVALLCGALLARRWGAVCVLGACAAVCGFSIASFSFGGVDEPVDSADHLTVMTINVLAGNDDYDAVASVIERADPDVLCIQEFRLHWNAGLAGTLAKYPHRVIAPREDAFAIALFSRLPMDDARVEYIGPASVPSIIADIDADGVAVHVIATHPLPPAGVSNAKLRDRQLSAIGAYIADRPADEAIVVLGDLNVTPWSSAWELLNEKRELKHARQGSGVMGTWPAHWPGFARIPIDHILHSEAVETIDCTLGPDVGSDHLPLWAKLRVTGGETGSETGREEPLHADAR